MAPDHQILSLMTIDDLIGHVADARARSLDLMGDLSDEQLLGPKLDCVNPGRWEIGHHAWFQSQWVLRAAAGQDRVRDDEDFLYDSMEIDHKTRWDLPLPQRSETFAYVEEVLQRTLALLRDNPSDEVVYHALYTTLHEDMHTEALTYTRQTHGWPAPNLGIQIDPEDVHGGGPLPGDVEIPGGTLPLGSSPNAAFVFDNEKWAHPVQLAPFRIARAAVTQAEFAAFVDAGGYNEARYWTQEGWQWGQTRAAQHPVHWQRTAHGWQRQHFDAWFDLEPNRPVIHISWFEADAYCRWAGRRLPTEAEWEAAAATQPDSGGLSQHKRPYPWGNEPPSPVVANLDWHTMGTVDVGALSAGDSAWGCRQMIGNVWEWTSTDFGPYPGFEMDPYKDYSAPWFHTRKVMRGGCWVTRSRLIRCQYRNFMTPDRRDILAGFRTCSV